MQTTKLISRKIARRIFPQAATKVLSELGAGVPPAVFFQIGQILGIPTEDVFEDPLRFSLALERLFSSGSTLIEDKIIQTMCEEFDLKFIRVSGTFEQKLEANFSTMKLPDFELDALEKTMTL